MPGIVKGAFRIASFGAVALLSNGVSGCGHGCSLVGCSSGLAVRIVPPPPAPYRVEVVGGPTSARRVWACEPGSPCAASGGATFENLVTTRALIEVVVGTDTSRREFTTIAYKVSRPNGEDCDPTCRNAEVTFALGSALQGAR